MREKEHTCSSTIRDINEQIFSMNSLMVLIVAIIIIFSNVFWFSVDFFNDFKFHLNVPIYRIVRSITIIYSIYIAIFTKAKFKKNNLYRFSMIFYDILMCFNIVILYTILNERVYLANDPFYGVSFASLYLFAICFIIFPSIYDSVIICCVALASVIAPLFLPGAPAYYLTPNLIMAIFIIIGYFVMRALHIQIAKRNNAYAKEIGLYHNLTSQSIATIANTIDAKDFYTHGHSRRVGEYARELAIRLGLNEEEQEEVYFAGLLHDVGKISVPNEILNKEGKLTDEEYNIIKKHSVDGYNILKEFTAFPSIAQAARWHHERIDGNGYPDRMRGEDLPYYAKIISVADSYDAMSSVRPYRKGLSAERIIEELTNGKNKQFDPQIADKMIEMIQQNVVPINLVGNRKVLPIDNDYGTI